MKQSRRYLFLLALLTFAASPQAQAKVFANSYISFELPDKWNCVLEQTEWVCRTTNPMLDSREAVIILTAKEVGPMDSLPAYEQHLKSPRVIVDRSGRQATSTVYKVEQRMINNHTWIDGMHLNSEVPSYYTRYLATVKDRIAVLVTFSAHRAHYTKYNNDFFRAILSLRVIAVRSNRPGGGGAEGGEGPAGYIPGGVSGLVDGIMPDEGAAGTQGSSDSTTFMGLALILGVIGLYLFMKKGKKKRR